MGESGGYVRIHRVESAVKVVEAVRQGGISYLGDVSAPIVVCNRLDFLPHNVCVVL